MARQSLLELARDPAKPAHAATDGILMILLTVMMLFFLTAVLVLWVDSLAMRWVEKGQPDPFHNLDQVPMARLRGLRPDAPRTAP